MSARAALLIERQREHWSGDHDCRLNRDTPIVQPRAATGPADQTRRLFRPVMVTRRTYDQPAVPTSANGYLRAKRTKKSAELIELEKLRRRNEKLESDLART
jgi:hypothetical protein